MLEWGSEIKNAKKALILLHGRGGTAADIISLAPQLADLSFYVVAPQAPGYTWYPYSFLEREENNDPMLTKSISTIKELIDRIQLPTELIFIAGFSQGACLALETSARYATIYGGVVAFTGGLIGHVLKESKYHGNFNHTPIYIGTSENDPHVPLKRCQETKVQLEKMGAEVTLQVFPGAVHQIRLEEIQAAKKLIN